MKIEIWSDIMCPFCYIGKRKFEAALAHYKHKDNIEIIWKSYQLAPDLKTQPDKNIHQFLAEHKGFSEEEAQKMNLQVAQMAAGEGLRFNYDGMVVANSFKAHQFAHFAKAHKKQNEAEEVLFRSHFTDGKNIDDIDTLVNLGKELKLDTEALRTALENNDFADAVKNDLREAMEIGVRGVPFFVFNRKYAVSGAQTPTVFTQTIEKSFEEWKASQPNSPFEIIEGQRCDVDGNCD